MTQGGPPRGCSAGLVKDSGIKRLPRFAVAHRLRSVSIQLRMFVASSE
jgi:hypothetical protein